MPYSRIVSSIVTRGAAGGRPASAGAAAFWTWSRLEHPGHYRLMFGAALPTPLAFDAPGSPGRRAFMEGVAAIAECQRARASQATDDPFRLTAMAWAAIHGLVILRLDRPNFPWPPLDDMAADTIRRLVALAPQSPA